MKNKSLKQLKKELEKKLLAVDHARLVRYTLRIIDLCNQQHLELNQWRTDHYCQEIVMRGLDE